MVWVKGRRVVASTLRESADVETEAILARGTQRNAGKQNGGRMKAVNVLAGGEHLEA